METLSTNLHNEQARSFPLSRVYARGLCKRCAYCITERFETTLAVSSETIQRPYSTRDRILLYSPSLRTWSLVRKPLELRVFKSARGRWAPDCAQTIRYHQSSLYPFCNIFLLFRLSEFGHLCWTLRAR